MGREKSARRGRGEGIDLDAVADELYVTPPADFVRVREQKVADARAAGQAELARRIHALHRPALAAWASNLLVRERPEAARQFLSLGEALRRAHRDLDRSQLRDLSSQQWRIISSLAREAVGLAHKAGQPLSDSVQRDVESTLRAVIADPDAAEQWATGRLVSPLTPPTGLRGVAEAPVPAAPAPTDVKGRDELAERRHARKEHLTQARQAAKDAERRLREQRKKQTAAEAGHKQARSDHERAQGRLEQAQQQLRQAEEEAGQAAERERDADTQRRAAQDSVIRAEHAAQDAAREVERLSR
jgi:hypothetical protein